MERIKIDPKLISSNGNGKKKKKSKRAIPDIPLGWEKLPDRISEMEAELKRIVDLQKIGPKSKEEKYFGNYDPFNHPYQAYHLAKTFGATNKEIAFLFNVKFETLCRWMIYDPRLKDSIRRGREDFDSRTIERSLRERATGYNFKEKTWERKPIYEEYEKEVNGEPIKKKKLVGHELVLTKEKTVHVPADVAAINTWLCNRQPERWRNQKYVNVNAKIEERKMELQLKANLDNLPREELERLQSILDKLDNAENKDQPKRITSK